LHQAGAHDEKFSLSRSDLLAYVEPVMGGGSGVAVAPHPVTTSDAARKHLVQEYEMTLMQRFIKDESGATAIEYGLIAGLVAVAIIAALTALGGSLDALFSYAATNVSSAAS